MILFGGRLLDRPWHEERCNRNNEHCSHPEFLGKPGCDDEKNEEGFQKRESLSEHRPPEPLGIPLFASREKAWDLVLFSIS